jgi:hypothetical protein
VTDQDESSSMLPASDAGHYKLIIAIGVMGNKEEVARFAALWITDSERRAHQINDRIFKGSLLLLPLPEVDYGEIPE